MAQPAQSIRDQLKKLESLQELDLKIEGLKKQKSDIPAALQAFDTEIEKLLATQKTKEAVVAEVQKVIRQARAAIELNEDRVKRANDKMDQVKSGPEYQAAAREIDQLKRYATTLGEQLKKAEGEEKNAAAEAAQVAETVAQKRAEREAKAGELGGQGIELDNRLDELLGKRGEFLGGVEKRIVLVYDRVRVARGGLGLVPAVGGRCKGCNMMVPPQLYNEVHRCNDVHACPSCHRLLFIPEMVASVTTTVAVTT